MNKDFSALKPALVWKHFAAICNIPHPSHHEEKIRQYVVDFAQAQGLEYCVDEANNVYVRKAATPGMENRKGIVIQAHLDKCLFSLMISAKATRALATLPILI